MCKNIIFDDTEQHHDFYYTRNYNYNDVTIVTCNYYIARKLTYYQMTLSRAINGQQDIPFFVIMAGYITHCKILCDMSA